MDPCLLASNIIFRFTDFLKCLFFLSFFTIFLYLSSSSHCLSLSIFLPSLPFAVPPPLSLPRLVTRKRSAREYVITLYGASIYARVSLSSSRHRQFKIKREHLPRARSPAFTARSSVYSETAECRRSSRFRFALSAMENHFLLLFLSPSSLFLSIRPISSQR